MATYPTMEEARTAGLFHCNCRHSTSAYLPGITDPYVHPEDPKGYEAAKKLRYLERQVRAKKRLESVAITPEAKLRATNSLEAYREKIRLHVEETGIRRQPWRESFGVSKKQLAAAKAQLAPPQDPQSPTEQYSDLLYRDPTMYTLAEKWSLGEHLKSVTQSSVPLFKGQKAPDTEDGRRATELFNAMNAAPRFKDPLYRGIHDLTPEQVKALCVEGSIQDLPLTSFTSSETIGKDFMALPQRKDAQSVMFVTYPGIDGIPGLQMPKKFGMDEVLTGGRFKVQQVKQAYGLSDKRFPYTLVVLEPVPPENVLTTEAILAEPEVDRAVQLWTGFGPDMEGGANDNPILDQFVVGNQAVRDASIEIMKGGMVPGEPGRQASALIHAIDMAPPYRGTLMRGMSRITPEQLKELSEVGVPQDIGLSAFARQEASAWEFMELENQNANPDWNSVLLDVDTGKGVKALDLGSFEAEVITGGRFETVSSELEHNVDGIPFTRIHMKLLAPLTLAPAPPPPIRSKFFDEVAISQLKRDMAKLSPAKAEALLMSHMDKVIEESGNPRAAFESLAEIFKTRQRKPVGSALVAGIKHVGEVNPTIYHSDATQVTATWIDKYLNPSLFSGKGSVISPTVVVHEQPGASFRAFCKESLGELHVPANATPETILHELTHVSQGNDKYVQKIVGRHFYRRTDGAEEREYSPTGEIYARDKFVTSYAGRLYTGSAMNQQGKELLSTGLELMYRDPQYLYNKDPELFKLTLAWMRGVL